MKSKPLTEKEQLRFNTLVAIIKKAIAEKPYNTEERIVMKQLRLKNITKRVNHNN
jgi:hypothetical protein